MTVANYYIQAQLDFLGIQLALAGEVPKRSGDFETSYKTESGKEVVVKRSPDGKFANKGGSSSQEPVTATVNVGKAFGKAVTGFADDIAKLPTKVQEAVREAMFDSELSRAIDKGVKKFVKSAYDPGLETGFKLGQSIKDELAKKPFSKFAETVTAKIEEFRKDLPQKSDDLKKEIIRIAKDPNTSTIVVAGALMALAGNFYIASFFSAYRAAGVTLNLLRLPNVATLATDIAVQIPELAATEGAATAIAKAALAVTKAMSAGVIAGELFAGTLYAAVGGMLTSHAGRSIMDGAKSNEAIEKEQLKAKILAKPENSDTLQRELSEQSAKEEKTKQKIIAEIQKSAPKKPDPAKPADNPLLKMPVLDIKLTKAEEDYVSNTKNKEEVLEAAYKDSEFKELSIAYMEVRAMEVANIFGVGFKMTITSDEVLKSINERLTVVIKNEIKRRRVENKNN